MLAAVRVSMSLLEHLDELRARLIRALWGLLASYGITLALSNRIWEVISAPAVEAVKHFPGDPVQSPVEVLL